MIVLVLDSVLLSDHIPMLDRFGGLFYIKLKGELFLIKNRIGNPFANDRAFHWIADCDSS